MEKGNAVFAHWPTFDKNRNPTLFWGREEGKLKRDREKKRERYTIGRPAAESPRNAL